MRNALAPYLIDPVVANALNEDLGRAGDITTQAVISPNISAVAVLASRKPGICCGVDIANHVFKYIESVDKRMEGQFKSIYEEEFFRRSDDGEELYNPFSQTQKNLNWRAISSMRKNFLISQMPRNFNNRFRNRSRKERYSLFQGATPTAETEGSRSRKTRKNRR